jgi:hypothetical protein
MNERIFELAKQADLIQWDTLPSGAKTPDYESVVNAKKFAELLIRECHEIIKKDMELAQIQLLPLDFGMYANGRLRRIIKEHFGVEE